MAQKLDRMAAAMDVAANSRDVALGWNWMGGAQPDRAELIAFAADYAESEVRRRAAERERRMVVPGAGRVALDGVLARGRQAA